MFPVRLRFFTAVILLTALVAALPAGAITYGAYGSRVLAAGTDFNPTYGAGTLAGATICARDTGVLTTTSDDLYYLNADGAGTTVAPFDLRLTTADGRTAGTLVSPGDTDVSQTFSGAGPGLVAGCAALAANLRSLEADGLPGWTAGDFLVWSTDTTLGAGDVRISVSTSSTGQDSQSVTAGTVVIVTDTDLANIANGNGLFPDCTAGPPTGSANCVASTILADAGNFVLRMFDANLNAALDTGDSVLAAYRPAATPDPSSYSLNDVYLLGGTYGSKVAASSADYIAEPEIVCGGAVLVRCLTTAPVLGYIRSIGASDTSCDRLFIHFRDHDGVGSLVLMDDIVLYTPATGLAACTNPPPTSAIVAGTRVTTATSHYQGTAFQATAPLAANIFFVDVSANNRFDLTDPVYINKPAAFGGGAGTCATAPLCVTDGDFRVTTVTAGAGTFAAGTIVGATDSDVSTFATTGINTQAGSSWVPRFIDNDGSDDIPLQTLPSIMIHDANGDSIWQPATESVYRDVGTTANVAGCIGTTDCVNNGDFLLHAGSDTALGAPSATTAISGCPGAADCSFTAASLLPVSSDFKVTGSDTTVEAVRGETVYFSKDAFVNSEDFALSAATGSAIGAGQVSCAANACANEGLHASDRFVFSLCAAGTCPPRVLQGEVQVGPTSGTRQASSGADFIPSLRNFPVAGATLLRYNKGDVGTITDDAYYASTDGATISTQDGRLVAFDAGRTAGSIVVSGDTQELSAAGDTSAGAAGGLAALFAARDVDGTTGYTLLDPVYVNNPGGALGGTVDAVLSAYDLRVTEATAGGQTYAAGTIVSPGHADLNSGTAYLNLGAWLFGYHDDNMNAVFDTGDVAYALPPGTPALSTFPQPPLGAIRLSGTAATGGGTTGGGGVVNPPVTTTTSTTTVTSTSTSDTSTSTDTDTGTTSSTSTQAPSLASLNLRIAASLEVERDGEDNVLTWDDVNGESGYQVFGSTSPFVLVDTLPAGTTTYRDEGADEDRKYLVTACVGTCELSADDVNDGDVPGYDEVPEGEGRPEGKKGWIPGPSPVLVLLALAGSALLLRRRLA